ncbi:thiamine pyrophosphate-binding protein [Hazenella coriacea]|uniref:Pyruvate dehydrogenase (Quinone)/pyruvate oxidase n=1 Tax=Hazenella coriacea TaxID=1179467 RepID=A0A4R3L9X1_9BACL|nr:thiamine pyrophosphate-dependent enzyme [Hazenella coriacea]TCS95925.1 pyruvate dehydrogenase (quinone)/pyruvate oxidase [Hazenella coriacea]
MSNEIRTVAKHLVDQLIAWECKRIYGVIGDANLYLLDELAKQDQIQYMGCRHETTAGLMASAEAKLTGKLSVCTATSGPGIMLLLNGLADAASDHAPVLAITGQVERRKLGTGTKQEIDQQRLLDPLALYTSMVSDPEAFPIQLNQAMRIAKAQGGVTHLSVPKDLWEEKVESSLFPPPPVSPRLLPNEQEFTSILERINQAQRPILLLGRGSQQTKEDVLHLADKIKAPMIATMPAKSYLPHDHPLFVGGLGQAGSEVATELLQMSDLCMILGATWWPEDYVPAQIPTIQIDVTEINIGKSHPHVASLIGDLNDVVPKMVQRLQTKENHNWYHLIQQKKAAWDQRVQEEVKQTTTPLAPQRVMEALSQAIDSEAVICLDVGDHTVWFERIFQFKSQDVLISGRWRTLGFGLPAAMAAKCTATDRQVVAIVGDGGFATTMVDLITAVKYQIPITVFIMNNGSYSMEKNRMKVAGLHELGSDLLNPDWVALAHSFGADGFRVENEEQLVETIQKALRSPKVAIVDIICDDPIIPHTHI